jgi:hypothetical protein
MQTTPIRYKFCGLRRIIVKQKRWYERKQTKKGTNSVAVGEQRHSSSSSCNCRVADKLEVEFVGIIVLLNCKMKYCKDLITSFGNKFTLETVCMEQNTEYGNLVGVIMRKSKVSGRRGTISDSYDVAWDFSALGESSLPSVVLVNASIAGSRVQQIQSF